MAALVIAGGAFGIIGVLVTAYWLLGRLLAAMGIGE